MKLGSKNIQSLCYGSKGIVKVMFGSKLIWEKFNAEEDINTILKSVIDGNELINMSSLLSHIESSNKDFSDINAQLEEIIGNNSIQQSAQVGDIAYWDGSSVKTTPLSSWYSSLGTPVGVVMIGEGFAPDGKARIISLTNMTYNGSEQIDWGGTVYTDSPVPNYKYIITTKNTDTTSFNTYCEYGNWVCFPTDRIESLPTDANITQSIADPLSYYTMEISLKPSVASPYVGNKLNPIYIQEVENGNALSDFYGLSNTYILSNDEFKYTAAQVCWNYKDNANSNLQWYLPALGELGILIARLGLINNSIVSVGGSEISGNIMLSTSTETDYGDHYGRWSIGIDAAMGTGYSKGAQYVRSVAML